MIHVVPSRHYSSRYLRNLFRRRGLYAAIPFVLIVAAALALARSLPDLYYAQGTVTIARQQVPESVVRSTVVVPFAERLRTTSEELKSPASLTALVKEFDLYPDARRTVPMEALVSWMARSIRIEQVRPDTVVVGFSGYERSKVAKVADRLTQRFIERSVQEREGLADTTSQFLGAELAAARARLVAQERRVQEYREKYAGELPSQTGTNLQILQGLFTQLQPLTDGLRQDRDRRGQLQALTPSPEPTERDEATVPADDPAPVEIDADKQMMESGAPLIPPGPVEPRLRVARAMLKAMLQKYTPEHPDVIQLQSAIQQLEAVAAVKRDAARRPAPTLLAADDPRRQRADAELARLDARIAEREAQERQLRQAIATYQARLEAVPRRESDWAELTRDYSTMEQGYTALLAKNQDSRLAANLERQRFGEQLNVSERPAEPSRPVSPNRPRIVIIGLVLGVGLGLGILALFEVTDTSLRAEGEVLAALQLPVLAMLPLLVTPAARRRRHRFAAATAVLLLIIVVVAVLRSA